MPGMSGKTGVSGVRCQLRVARCQMRVARCQLPVARSQPAALRSTRPLCQLPAEKKGWGIASWCLVHSVSSESFCCQVNGMWTSPSRHFMVGELLRVSDMLCSLCRS